MTYKTIIIFFFFLWFFFIPDTGQCTIEWPGGAPKNLVEEHKQLSNTDKIKIVISDRILVDRKRETKVFANEISDTEDIKVILVGFSNCSAGERCEFYYHPCGTITFYSKSIEIFQLELSFHYWTPVFFKGNICYMVYNNEKFENIFYKYLPEHIREGLLKQKENIKKGLMH